MKQRLWRCGQQSTVNSQQSTVNFKTAEGIDVQPIYGPEDVRDLAHLGFVAGIPPYLRGPYSTMYV
ncbi:MAG: hypothetical protein HKM97_11635, partial [Acidimicrobiia bacterium]|nr:hypothetical protein [Acidimicrobiia bacterium]